jgi:hypothetical protein
MSSVQKWFIVVAIYIAAIGVLLGAFQGRYKYASFETEAKRWTGGRFDTWTGEVSVKNYDQPKGGKICQWEGFNPNFVKDIK